MSMHEDHPVRQHLEYIEKDLLQKIKTNRLFAIMGANHGLQQMIKVLIEVDKALEALPDTTPSMRVRESLSKIQPIVAIVTVAVTVAATQLGLEKR